MSRALRDDDIRLAPEKVPPICMWCTHLEADWTEEMTCVAFPDGIPQPILDSKADHRQPYGRDGGIQFEAKAGEAIPDLVLSRIAAQGVDSE